MKLRLLLLLVVAFAGTYLVGQGGSKNASSSQNSSPKLPEIHGFDLSVMDRSADPCNDFYQFVCGSWVKNNPIRVPPETCAISCYFWRCF